MKNQDVFYAVFKGDEDFEKGWWYKAELWETPEEFNIVDETSNGFGHTVPMEFFHKNFFCVPKPLYDYYIYLCQEGEDTSDIQKHAQEMYDNED